MNPKYFAEKPLQASSRVYATAQKRGYANLRKALEIELKSLGLKSSPLWADPSFARGDGIGLSPEELLTIEVTPKKLFYTGGPSAYLRGPTREGVVIVDICDETKRPLIEALVEKLGTGLELDFRYVESMPQIKKRVKESQIHYQGNSLHLDGVLVNERGYASRIPKGEDVVTLMSGGLDSSIMVHKMIEDWGVRVHPLFVKRSSRNEKYEEEAFDFFVDFYTKRFPKNIGSSKKLAYEVPPRELRDDFPSALAKTIGHPLRNSTLQNIAVMYAVSLQTKGIDAKTIFSGSVAEDNTEPELGLLSLRAQTLTTCIEMGDWRWNITSPLTDPYLVDGAVRKVDLIQYAFQKFIPIDKTRTCFSSEEIADGTCNACVKRLGAFKHLNMLDPIKYQEVK